MKQNSIQQLKKIGIWIILGVIAYSCAKPLSPTGGPKDEDPPELVKSNPKNQTLNFNGDIVRFYFNEPIRKPTFDKEIFISPFTRRPKVILADNSKRFKIKFQEPLRPQTTYVITLTEIKDNSESNAIEEAYTIAFSTGDQLDSMELKGRIQSPRLGEGVKDMIVMLFDADSAINGDFMGQRPSYLTKADEKGSFSFQYLRNAPFRILAVKDADQSNSYSQPNEQIAIAQDTLISFPDDSTNLATVKLYAFLPDKDAPRLQDYDWINDSTLACRFNENLRLDTIQIMMTDTLGADSIKVDAYSWYRHKDPELLIHMPRPKEVYSDLHIRFMSDSLWNMEDTIVRIEPIRTRTEEEPILQKPALEMEKEAWKFLTYRKLTREDMQMIVLADTGSTDSSRKIFTYTYEQDGFNIRLQPDPLPDSVMPYVLRVSGQLLETEDEALLDSTFEYTLNWFDPEEFGEIQGVVRLDSSWEGPIILRLMDKETIVETTFDTTFHFRLLKPADYTFQIVQDQDSNQVWSPGEIFPPRLPERIYLHDEPISVKANWEFEEHVIEMKLKPEKAIAEADTDTDEEGEEESEEGENENGLGKGKRGEDK